MSTALQERLRSALGLEVVLASDMPVAVVPRDQWFAAARALRDALGFDMLLDITAVDWLPSQGDKPRFEVVAHFFSTTGLQRVRLKTRVEEADPSVASLVPLYGAANFAERECHDMFGIRFTGNADLRPSLLYEGFVGHPLRKDYPKHQEQPLVKYRDLPGANEG